jgi:hypothetical protein
VNEEFRPELTPTEAYLIRLLNFKNLKELTEWLNASDNLEALSHMEPPYEFYEEITKAEEASEMVEDLERLYALSSPLPNGPA